MSLEVSASSVLDKSYSKKRTTSLCSFSITFNLFPRYFIKRLQVPKPLVEV